MRSSACTGSRASRRWHSTAERRLIHSPAMIEYVLMAVVVALVVLIGLAAAILVRLTGLARSRDRDARDAAELRGLLEAFGRDAANHERDIRADLATARNESTASGAALRKEVGETLSRFTQATGQQLTGMAALQQEQLKSFADRLVQLTQAWETRIESLRKTLEERLDVLRAENTAKLEQMRATVDEKLQTTLEQRLGASFKHVSERLEQVHKGLGEMQTLATGVGDLKRVLTDVKSRGTWGEVQLGALLADVLPPSHYAQNVATRPG